MDFDIKLSYELWEDIFAEKNVNTAFNNFLNTYLRIFYSSFPLKKVYFKSYNKAWLTSKRTGTLFSNICIRLTTGNDGKGQKC
jgi:hypothetical protein